VAGYGFVSFLTDYGLDDGFVAACHGVLLSRAPSVRIIDITHAVPPGNVRRGAAVLAQTVPWLPAAVHVAVVDPGVGTERRAIAVATPAEVLIGPDNGLLSWAWPALDGAQAAVLLDPITFRGQRVSHTFHGRDVFTPAAAELAMGAELQDLGQPLDVASLVRLPKPRSRVQPGVIEAEVLTIDRYGNVQLAASASQMQAAGLGMGNDVVVQTASAEYDAQTGHTFAAVERGRLVVLDDSAGHLAIASNQDSAARTLDVSDGDVIIVRSKRRRRSTPSA
jgi:S-adenosyl-L-methionine hydrolase (adenosine-forming)